MKKKKKKLQQNNEVTKYLKMMSQRAKGITKTQTITPQVTSIRDSLEVTQRDNIPQIVADVKDNVVENQQDPSQVLKTFKVDLWIAKINLDDWPLIMKQDSLTIIAAKKINDTPLDLQITSATFANVYINQNGSVKNMSSQTLQVYENALIKWPNLVSEITGLPQIDNVFYFLRFSDALDDDTHRFNDSLFLIQKTQVRSVDNLEKDKVVLIQFTSWNLTKIDKNYKAIVLKESHPIFQPQAYGHIQYKTNKHTLLNYGGLKIVGEGQKPLKLSLQEGVEADTDFNWILTPGLLAETSKNTLYFKTPITPTVSEVFNFTINVAIENINTYSLSLATFTYTPATPIGFEGVIKDSLIIQMTLKLRATGFIDNNGILHPIPNTLARQIFDLEIPVLLSFHEATKTASINLGAGVRRVTFDEEIPLNIGDALGREYVATPTSTMDITFTSRSNEDAAFIFTYEIKDNNQIVFTPVPLRANTGLLIKIQLNHFTYRGTYTQYPYLTEINFGLQITGLLPKTGSGVFEVLSSQDNVVVVPMIPLYKTQTSKDNVTPSIFLFSPYFDRTTNDIQNVGALIYRLKGTDISTSWIKDDAIYGYGTNKPDISFTNIYYSRMFFWMWYFTFGYQRNFGYAVYAISSNDFWGAADSRATTTLPAKFTDFLSTAEGGLYLAETLLTATKAVPAPEQFGNVMLSNYRQQFGLSLDTGTGKVTDDRVPYNYTLFNFFSEQIFWDKLLNNGALQGNGIYSVLSFHLATYYLQPTWNRQYDKNVRYKALVNDPTPYLIGQYNQHTTVEDDLGADGVAYVDDNCPLSMFATTPRTQSSTAPFPPLILSVAITNIWFNCNWYHEDFKFTDQNLTREQWDFQASSGDNTSYIFKDVQTTNSGGDFPKLYLTDEAKNMNVKHLTNNGNKIQVLPLPNPILDKISTYVKNEFDTAFIDDLFIFPQNDCSKWPSTKFMDKDDLIKYFKDSPTDQLNIVVKIEMDDAPVLLKKATKKKKALYKTATWPVTFQLKQIDLRGIYGGDGNVLLLDSNGNTLVDINSLEKSQFQYFDEENDTNSLTQIFVINDDD